jgi:hypothetical protein
MWQILGKEDKMKKFNLKKLTVTAILAAVAVVGSLLLYLFISIQHIKR